MHVLNGEHGTLFLYLCIAGIFMLLSDYVWVVLLERCIISRANHRSTYLSLVASAMALATFS